MYYKKYANNINNIFFQYAYVNINVKFLIKAKSKYIQSLKN